MEGAYSGRAWVGVVFLDGGAGGHGRPAIYVIASGIILSPDFSVDPKHSSSCLASSWVIPSPGSQKAGPLRVVREGETPIGLRTSNSSHKAPF